jgi:hypothetical protein
MEALNPSLEDLLGELLRGLDPLTDKLFWLLVLLSIVVPWQRKRDASRGGSDAPDAPRPDGSLWAPGPDGSFRATAPPHVWTPLRVRDLAPAALGLVAFGMWIAANLLPAIVATDGTCPGWILTLFGWGGIFTGPPPTFGWIGVVVPPLSILGWSANALALGAVVVSALAWADADRGVGLSFLAIALASAAVACSADGILWLATSRYVVSIEIGTWVWFTSLVVVVGSTLSSAYVRRHRAAVTGRSGA